MYDQSLKAYRSVGLAGRVGSADRHGLIQILMEAGLEQIAMARGHMQREEIAAKGGCISKAITIVEGLRLALDHEQGEIAANLERLYDYMGRRLVEANLRNDPELLDEVGGLLKEIKLAWDEVPAQLEAAGGSAAGG